jgi:heme-degrading monooxygenase HmoA
MTVVRVATYPVDSSQVPDMVAQAEAELYPIYKAHDGFQSLSIVHVDDDFISISYWDSVADAEAGSQAAIGWAKSVAGVTGPPSSVRMGEEVASAKA